MPKGIVTKGAFKKGHAPTKPKGTKNKKTEQWEVFSAYCLEGGLEKFQQELNKLEGKDYVNAFTNLLEFHKPKLQRSELTGKDGENLNSISVLNISIDSKQIILK